MNLGLVDWHREYGILWNLLYHLELLVQGVVHSMMQYVRLFSCSVIH
jgi:hypothetical protein